ncbi:hypothetical protein SARC_12862 [Sphaeroforma arctica JP610]|uniref:Protein kinase domain-containing protein n=1 Tax=Sphaeroforma arctica JP610 TaxID=667725 RepID=A0A0L0FCW9_9EUKA|nr:hypothetical protein SARC_12862 [Sphaeroforma arctica JP610]KNC74597.1 hypothetical protein SARC_12862 [Sphaeroforma arctica JP610]|eukprot:XP_014148499.1 hypothetical protein SARC_12862 [Sphaeroforma arctica JP610]
MTYVACKLVNVSDVIVKELGKGTFATVVACKNLQTNRTMAVKIIKNITKYREAAFLEIKALRELQKCDKTNAEYGTFGLCGGG